MNQGRTAFSQLLGFLPDREFRRCVARYGGDVRPRGFSCWDQYLAMAFAQLTYRESLRDIERELWIKALGLNAILPPPEEQQDVKNAIAAAKAEQTAKRAHLN